MTILANSAVRDGLIAHIAAAEQIDDPAEMTGIGHVVDHVFDYFDMSLNGVPHNSGAFNVMVHVLMSAIYEGKVAQSDIDQFLSMVDVDPIKTFRAWLSIPPDERKAQKFSHCLVPGTLEDHDINDVARALFAIKGNINEQN